MEWQRQVVSQSIIVGAITVASINIPSGPVRTFAIAFGLWFVWAIWRNPRFYLQRLARIIVLAVISLVTIGANARIKGQVRLPGGHGELGFDLEQASSDGIWMLLGLAFLCLLLDAGITLYEHSRLRKVVTGAAVDPKIFLKGNGDITLSTDLLVGAPGGGMIGGADLFVGGLLPCRIGGEIHLRDDDERMPMAPLDRPVTIAAGGKLELRIAGTVSSGLSRAGLRLRARAPLALLFPLQGFVVLTAVPSDLEVPIPLTWQVSWPPPRPASA